MPFVILTVYYIESLLRELEGDFRVCPQGNMQRCKLVMDQVTEARDTMMKVLDHKEKVLKLLNKNGSVKKSSKLKRKERA